jgi:hypothetical protein
MNEKMISSDGRWVVKVVPSYSGSGQSFQVYECGFLIDGKYGEVKSIDELMRIMGSAFSTLH